jgi:hypothetical protein
MPYTFRLTFHGLCAFVPNGPLDVFDGTGQPVGAFNQITLILPDLANPPALSPNEPHLPFVRYSPLHLVSSNAATDRASDLIFHQGRPDELRSCLLNREQLSLSSNGGLGALQIVNRRPAGPPAIAAGEEDLIFWMAKASGMAPLALSGALAANHPIVAGRMFLTAGRFRTLETGRAVFDLPNGRRQRLATKVAVEYVATDNQTFTLSFQRFGGGAAKTLVFGRTAAAGNPGVVEVEIKNREAFDLIGASPQQNPDDASEFDFIYQLMSNPPAGRPTPKLVPSLPPLNAAGVRPTLRTLCPPVALDGFI